MDFDFDTALQDILAMMSHDLRTPLAVIGMIREQVRRTARMVDEMGNAVALETEQVVLRRENLDLRLLARDAVERPRSQTERQWSAASGCPPLTPPRAQAPLSLLPRLCLAGVTAMTPVLLCAMGLRQTPGRCPSRAPSGY